MKYYKFTNAMNSIILAKYEDDEEVIIPKTYSASIITEAEYEQEMQALKEPEVEDVNLF